MENNNAAVKTAASIKQLAEFLLQSNYAMVLTGAGMDTESNIPDFRGKDGLWQNIDARVVADINTIRQNYKLFHQFYKERLTVMGDVLPHAGHYALAEMEKRGIIKGIATQNISGLHLKAGSKKVYELHGDLKKIFCNNCGKPATAQELYDMKPCSACHEYALRPNVVFFGEALPAEVWNKAVAEIKKSDLLLIIGTSLEVAPVNQLPYLTAGKTVFINTEDVGHKFNLTVLGKAKGVLTETLKYINA
ncbi:MAG: NAD-dependent deacylase [Dethiobacteraceae bacterium]